MTLSIDVYGPGRDITGRATAALAAKRFLRISGNETDGVMAVAPATAGGRTCGVAKYAADPGELVGVARGASRVVRVTAAAPIAAFAEVEVGADGKAVTKTTGVSVGYATTAAATDGDAFISLNA
ncbi:capsid cement protein [Prescottella equi]|uniref:capsid cement protein n=1 Tax=Rhodococcus hoagii TaxID=43767 RepID=UPI00384EDE89